MTGSVEPSFTMLNYEQAQGKRSADSERGGGRGSTLVEHGEK